MNDYIFNQKWFRILFKGSIVTIFSVFILLQSVMVPFGLAYFLGLLMIFAGLLTALGSVNESEDNPKWWVNGIEGLIDIAIGTVMLALPNAAILFTSMVLVSFTVFAVIYHQQYRTKIKNQGWSNIFYAVGLLIVFIFANLITPLPGISPVVLLLLAGTGGLLLSGYLIYTGLRLKEV